MNKKHHLFFAGVFLFCQYYTATAQQIACHYDSLYRFINGNTQLYLDSVEYFTYDNRGNLTTQLQTQNHLNHAKIVCTYDMADNQLSTTLLFWNDTLQNWRNANRTLSTYNAQNKLTGSTEQQWDTAWLSVAQHLHVYTGAGGDSVFIYLSSSDGVTWSPMSQSLYTYDANHNLTTDLQQDWAGANWNTTGRALHTYNNQNKRLTTLQQIWSNSVWQDGYRILYTYDANNNLISEHTDNWYNQAWASQDENVYSFDSLNRQTGFLYRYRPDSAAVWDTIFMQQFHYNTAGNLLYRTGFNKIPDGYQLADSTYYFYNCAVAGIPSPTASPQFALFPNPATNTVTLTVDESMVGATATITDLTGAVVLTGQLTKISTQLSTQNLSHGIYNVCLVSHNYTGTNRKLIIIK